MFHHLVKSTLILITAFSGLTAGAFAAPYFAEDIPYHSSNRAVGVAAPAPSPRPVKNEKVGSFPVRLRISKLQIDTDIEHVANDRLGNMDTPEDSFKVAWYKPGYIPGNQGKAVIAGHYDTETGPAIFAGLSSLVPGDKVEIITKSGNTKTFIIEKIKTYSDASFPMEEVFGKSNESYLNLITCTGEFNDISQSYSDRTVVYSKLQTL